MTVYRFFVNGKEVAFTFHISTAVFKERELRKEHGKKNVSVKEERFNEKNPD